MTPRCPLCDNTGYKLVFPRLAQFPDSKIVKCSGCQHVYSIHEQLTATGNLYNEGAYQLIENRKSIYDKILSKECKKIIERINHYKHTKGQLLDFGSGKGKFASIAKANGWQVKCVETSQERAEYANKVWGLEVNTNNYSTGNIFNQDFDVLVLLHVLEHFQRPRALFHELINANLTKDALVIIEVPNFKSWQAGIAGKNWMHLDPPRHISHFTPKRLDQFASDEGLKLLKTSNFSFHLGVLGMTDSILKMLGYRKNIIQRLKTKKDRLLVILILPFSFLLEVIAAFIGRGGIVRKYFIRVAEPI